MFCSHNRLTGIFKCQGIHTWMLFYLFSYTALFLIMFAEQNSKTQHSSVQSFTPSFPPAYNNLYLFLSSYCLSGAAGKCLCIRQLPTTYLRAWRRLITVV